VEARASSDWQVRRGEWVILSSGQGGSSSSRGSNPAGRSRRAAGAGAGAAWSQPAAARVVALAPWSRRDDRVLFSFVSVAAWSFAAACLGPEPLPGRQLARFDGDVKAYRAGDVLTVQVLENSSAVSSADTGTRRGNSLRAELSHGGSPVAQTQRA